jgi:hypothetical protein
MANTQTLLSPRYSGGLTSMGRRSHVRYPAYDHVTVTGLAEQEPPIAGFLVSVSQQGVRLMLQLPLSIGKVVKLRISDTVLFGRVVYSDVEGNYFCTGIAVKGAVSGAGLSELLRSMLIELPPAGPAAAREKSAPVRRTVSRHHLRFPASGTFSIVWRANDGGERTSHAKIANASRKGVRLRIGEMIPIQSSVSFNDAAHGVHGTASVRYCRFVNGSYDVGLEFSAVGGPQPGAK